MNVYCGYVLTNYIYSEKIGRKKHIGKVALNYFIVYLKHFYLASILSGVFVRVIYSNHNSSTPSLFALQKCEKSMRSI